MIVADMKALTLAGLERVRKDRRSDWRRTAYFEQGRQGPVVG